MYFSQGCSRSETCASEARRNVAGVVRPCRPWPRSGHWSDATPHPGSHVSSDTANFSRAGAGSSGDRAREETLVRGYRKVRKNGADQVLTRSAKGGQARTESSRRPRPGRASHLNRCCRFGVLSSCAGAMTALRRCGEIAGAGGNRHSLGQNCLGGHVRGCARIRTRVRLRAQYCPGDPGITQGPLQRAALEPTARCRRVSEIQYLYPSRPSRDARIPPHEPIPANQRLTWDLRHTCGHCHNSMHSPVSRHIFPSRRWWVGLLLCAGMPFSRSGRRSSVCAAWRLSPTALPDSRRTLLQASCRARQSPPEPGSGALPPLR